MKYRVFIFLLLSSLSYAAIADDTSSNGEQIRQRFDEKYKNYMGAASQSLLPFPQLERKEWDNVRVAQALQPVFSESDVFYNNKTYTFTMYQAKDGKYYLDAKGGFWGMDELFYGPIDASQLQ